MDFFLLCSPEVNFFQLSPFVPFPCLVELFFAGRNKLFSENHQISSSPSEILVLVLNMDLVLPK